MKELIGILQQLSKDESEDSRLKKYARRTLATLGILGNTRKKSYH
jgi:hypothetical protein